MYLMICLSKSNEKGDYHGKYNNKALNSLNNRNHNIIIDDDIVTDKQRLQ